MRRHAAVSFGDQEYMRAEATGIMRLGTVTPGAALVSTDDLSAPNLFPLSGAAAGGLPRQPGGRDLRQWLLAQGEWNVFGGLCFVGVAGGPPQKPGRGPGERTPPQHNERARPLPPRGPDHGRGRPGR